MKCLKCKSTVEDKKFVHPLEQDEYLCFKCFDTKLAQNRAMLSPETNVSFGGNLSEGGLRDDLNLGFVLCTEGRNNNEDGFDHQGLSSDYETAINQRLDWEHTNEVVGTITNSQFIEGNDKEKIDELGLSLSRSFIYLKGLLWKFWNTDRAKEVVARYRFGSLFYSMESLFDYVVCSQCNNEYVFDDEYCDHLSGRFSTKAGAYRILRGNKFAGAGIVIRPADRDAVGIALARDNMRYKLIEKILDPDLCDYYRYQVKRINGKSI